MNREEHIRTGLFDNFKYLKENYPQYNIIYLGLQGSQNYNLDIYEDDYKSDIDSKAICVPSLKDIASNRSPVSTTIVLPNNEHIDVKDLRLMIENFKKQNINFLEILFTKYNIINKDYIDLVNELLKNRENIAHYNTNQALRCMCGMSMEKMKALEHPYPSIIEKINKYGYDGKQLHHILRMNLFIKSYIKNKNFMTCLTDYTEEDYKKLIDYKKNKPSLEEAREIAFNLNNETKEIKDKNLKEKDIINKEAEEFLKEIQYKIIKRALILDLNKTEC